MKKIQKIVKTTCNLKVFRFATNSSKIYQRKLIKHKRLRNASGADENGIISNNTSRNQKNQITNQNHGNKKPIHLYMTRRKNP